MAKRKVATLPTRDARINIRLQKDLRDALTRLAREDGRSLSAYVERALAEHADARGTGSSRSSRKSGR
jgi:uncharacterized protein (DUF1778 family)